jgi:carboxyl-terminal processing protease
MSRRSFWAICVVVGLSYLCYQRAEKNSYGRHFAEIVEVIDRNYIEAVDDRKLFEAAMSGMVSSLDEHSGFVTPEETEQFNATLNQQFGGVGIEVSLDPKTKSIIVMSPLVGKPAYRAGVRAGDRIIKINGQSTEGFELQDAVKVMRGPLGESVTVTVIHEGETEPVDYQMVRETIQVESVLGDTRAEDGSWNFLLPGHEGIAYIRLTNFGEHTVDELAAVVDQLRQNKLKGVILDLRNNPGGLLPAAKGVCELFLPTGKEIVEIRTRGGHVEERLVAESDNPLLDVPLVVMVNHYSASASEIVAACLQDDERATIVGDRTWGKGTVQRVIPVEGGRSILKLTTATYWRPSNQNIHRLSEDVPESAEWGVKPDEGWNVPTTDEELAAWFEMRRQRDVFRDQSDDEAEAIEKLDKQLAKALEAVKLSSEKK